VDGFHIAFPITPVYKEHVHGLRIVLALLVNEIWYTCLIIRDQGHCLRWCWLNFGHGSVDGFHIAFPSHLFIRNTCMGLESL